jgi:hypothetical protein
LPRTGGRELRPQKAIEAGVARASSVRMAQGSFAAEPCAALAVHAQGHGDSTLPDEVAPLCCNSWPQVRVGSTLQQISTHCVTWQCAQGIMFGEDKVDLVIVGCTETSHDTAAPLPASAGSRRRGEGTGGAVAAATKSLKLKMSRRNLQRTWGEKRWDHCWSESRAQLQSG